MNAPGAGGRGDGKVMLKNWSSCYQSIASVLADRVAERKYRWHLTCRIFDFNKSLC